VDLNRPGAYGWDPTTHTFAAMNQPSIARTSARVGAGAVAAGGFITLLKTMPTIVAAFKGSIASLRGGAGAGSTSRTNQDIPSAWSSRDRGADRDPGAPAIPPRDLRRPDPARDPHRHLRLLLRHVSSRIVGIIGTSSNGLRHDHRDAARTSLLFVGLGWTGDFYQPMVLCVGGMVAIAAANAGRDQPGSQDRVPRRRHTRAQQIGLLIGVVAASLVIGFTSRCSTSRPSMRRRAWCGTRSAARLFLLRRGR